MIKKKRKEELVIKHICKRTGCMRPIVHLLVLSVYLNKNLKLEKILNRSENGMKQFTRFNSKHMTLVIDNKK